MDELMKSYVDYAVELGTSGLQVGLIIAAFNIARTVFNQFSFGRSSFNNI